MKLDVEGQRKEKRADLMGWAHRGGLDEVDLRCDHNSLKKR